MFLGAQFKDPMLEQPLEIIPQGPVRASVSVPGSKSISNRAILLAALAAGESNLRGFADCDDSRVMITALSQLGCAISWHGANLSVQGCGTRLMSQSEAIHVGDAGTVARFLLPALAGVGQGRYYLTSGPQIAKRPMAELWQALLAGGAVLEKSARDFFPLHVKGGSFQSGAMSLACATSSQFLSGLLLTAPFLAGDTTIAPSTELVSRTYIEMTIAVLAAFGLEIRGTEQTGWQVKGGQRAVACDYAIEPDASSASYFLALPLITGGEIFIPGLTQRSLQGDICFVHLLERMGASVAWQSNGVRVAYSKPLKGIDVDMNTMSDVAPTLAVLGLFACGRTRIVNIANMRVKESDRIDTLTKGLRALGAVVQEEADSITVHGDSKLCGNVIDSQGDHRMAMAFALAGLRVAGVRISEPHCVKKTFPDFFDVLNSLPRRRL